MSVTLLAGGCGSPGSSTSAPAPAQNGSCAQKAGHAFIQLSRVVPAAGGGLTVTGNAATMICGGPDDFHFSVASGTETGTVRPGADIEVFPLQKMAEEKIAASKLAAYLAADQDTKIFLVGGSLPAITSLQEQFHP